MADYLRKRKLYVDEGKIRGEKRSKRYHMRRAAEERVNAQRGISSASETDTSAEEEYSDKEQPVDSLQALAEDMLRLARYIRAKTSNEYCDNVWNLGQNKKI